MAKGRERERERRVSFRSTSINQGGTARLPSSKTSLSSASHPNLISHLFSTNKGEAIETHLHQPLDNYLCPHEREEDLVDPDLGDGVGGGGEGGDEIGHCEIGGRRKGGGQVRRGRRGRSGGAR